MKTTEFEELVRLARPIDDNDWGSERQIYLENQVYYAIEKILSEQEMEKFELWANKATVEERLDRALELWRATATE